MLPKLSIGIPFYGTVAAEWWTQMIQLSAALTKSVDIVEIITCGTMTADHSRNLIAGDFLKSNAEWLFWIDSDTQVPVGAVERLLAHGRPLVSGLYYGKNPPNPPIAYFKHNGGFQPIDGAVRWDKGEIIKVDAAGMGCMLTHRSVFEDIQKNFEVLQIPGGGLVTVHKNDILGDIGNTEGPYSHEHDGKVYKGQLRTRLIKPTLANLRFPFFMIDHLRTEDMYFFELAERVGHSLYLDTSVECGHLRTTPFQGSDYRDAKGH
jgi:hypothetical protein